MRPVGLGSVLPAIESFAQSSDLGNIPSSPSMETFERYCHLRNKLSSPLMETFAQPRDCTKKSPLPRWRPLHNCLFRDGQSSPAPSPVCWGRLGWGSPYHTGGYANVSLMETSAQPRDCTKRSPLPTWERVRACPESLEGVRGIRQVMQSPPRWDRFEVRACPDSLEGVKDAHALKLCFTLAGSLAPPGRPLMGAGPYLARGGARLD